MTAANHGCTQAHMDAMIPYFNACSFSEVPDSFFGFSSGSNYYYSPADFQWYCYTTYGLLLTGKGLPATPPTQEPRDPLAPLPTLSAPPPPPPAPSTGSTSPASGSSSNTVNGSDGGGGISVAMIGGIVAGVVVVLCGLGFWWFNNSRNKAKPVVVHPGINTEIVIPPVAPVKDVDSAAVRSILSRHTDEHSIQVTNQSARPLSARHSQTPASTATSGFPTEKHAGIVSSEYLHRAAAARLEKSGGTSVGGGGGAGFDVYAELEERRRGHLAGGGGGAGTVGTGSTRDGVEVQIVYVEPQTVGGGEVLPVVAPPAYANY
ncbi:hypothetical protein HDU98_007557 [Podochytrium sp. JEL0797]|nr:hypothetical protein HDU98_007557 [Podochytrium sp. JEL0797]